MMTGENGLGEQYKQKLEAHHTYLFKEFGDLGIDNQMIPPFIEENNADYVQKYFGNTTVVEAMAISSHWVCQILQSEIKILQILLNADYDRGDGFKRYMSVVFLENDSLNVGDILRAQVYMAEKLPKSGAIYKVNGQEIPNDDGKGLVKIKAKGKGWQTWQGSVTFNIRGRDTTLFFEQRYFVK
jgi:hypothetical protein